MLESERRYIASAAEKIDKALMVKMGHARAPTLDEVKRLVHDENIQLEQVEDDPGLVAELIPLDWGRYRIRYNMRLPMIAQMIKIYHELAEYKALQSNPGLFDDDLGMAVFGYTGMRTRADFRHLAAVECEVRLITRLKAAGHHIPQGVILGLPAIYQSYLQAEQS